MEENINEQAASGEDKAYQRKLKSMQKVESDIKNGYESVTKGEE